MVERLVVRCLFRSGRLGEGGARRVWCSIGVGRGVRGDDAVPRGVMSRSVGDKSFAWTFEVLREIVALRRASTRN